MKKKTEEGALKTVGKLAARKVPKIRMERAMRAYYKAAGRDVPEELNQRLRAVTTKAEGYGG